MRLGSLTLTYWATIFLSFSIPVEASHAQQRDFNGYILDAIEIVNRDRSKRGYDMAAFYTQDINYGSSCCLKPNRAPKTMCVAAMVEVIAEALNLYGKSTGDYSFEAKLPLIRWKRATRRDILPYLFRHTGFKSQGTADAIDLFGIGSRIPFRSLRPGDFINFSRTSGTGHAAIFLGFVDVSGNVVAYSQNIVGFRYFSAQGKDRPDGGFGFRIGLFEGKCNANVGNWARKDCKIIRRENDFWLNSGYLFSPSKWKSVTFADAQIEALAIGEARESLLGVGGTADELEAMAEEIAKDTLAEELDLSQSDSKFDGIDVDVEP